eukprot:CAMPEP_0197836344 /NCGR_PEP_ID=MMETSP1437-20131217/28638_1 /TAXON_ID=49252 ORGANISM="Eucampia antarctica, Strain CCMP1452" /NCGR_SAMPLE_ID=MMETSP1437 /ASSEMBLY_ACC=CAM_ASM_001096 /LENGTH=277 /DNA_ID=CAMNT_0043442447 /DNA_START=48 /DNA_END=881 /DNA_ORIENTATION=+
MTNTFIVWTLSLALLMSLGSAFVPGTHSQLAFSSSRKSSHYDGTALEMAADFSKVFVAGGTRGVGRLLINKLLEDENVQEVVALARSDEAVAELSAVEGVTVVQGDAMHYKTVEGAMDGCKAAITTLGGYIDEEGKMVDYEGNNNVIEAAGILGVTRVILVTSIGCGDSKDAAPPAVFESLKDVLGAKERAERILQRYYTNMNWTIIRPGGLKTEPMTGTAILTEDKTAIGSIHREDLANLVVKALSSPNTEKKVLSAFDPANSAGEAAKTAEEFVL